MSDIFLNPIGGGGGGGTEVSYTYLNNWFNTLGSTPNATPNKLALRNGSGSCSFADISANKVRVNASGSSEPFIYLTDSNGGDGYEITTDRNAGLPNLYLKNTNNSGILHLQCKNEVVLQTNHGGSTQNFGFYPNGNANFPTGGTVQTGAVSAQNSQSTLHSVVVNNNISASSVIYTNSSVNSSGAVQIPKTNTGFTTYTNYTSVNVSGQNLVGQATIQTNGFNNISSANVNISTRPTIELWTRNRSLNNTGTLGGSLDVSGATSNISYGTGFTTYGLDNRVAISGATCYFGWSVSGATNNASGNPAFTISFWHYLDAASWQPTGTGSNTIFAFGTGKTSSTACFFNQQNSVTTGPRYFFSQDNGAVNGNLTASVRTWNHYVVVNSGGGAQTIYVNGASAATVSTTLNLSGTNPLQFGTLSGDVSITPSHLGLFRYACFRIFPAAFTATQVTDLYNERFINPFLQTGDIVNIPRSLFIGSAAYSLTVGNFWDLELQTDAARKLTTTTWSTGSDERIKEQIEEANYDMCYSVMKNLPLKYYKYKDDFIAYGVNDKHKLGWIAQDVEQYYPKAISVGDSYGIHDFKNLNADQIYACMYGTIKKLMKKVEQLENKLGIEEVVYDLSLNDLSNNILNIE